MEFLTGAMQLNLIKKNGNTIKNNPNYISSFPIVLPGKEFFIVYVTKEIFVDDKDILSFNLTDRLKKNALKVSIPGSSYNEEKKRGSFKF